ncbi:hypothetical protein ACYOEI_18395 [Singulisphaera rosea]
MGLRIATAALVVVLGGCGDSPDSPVATNGAPTPKGEFAVLAEAASPPFVSEEGNFQVIFPEPPKVISQAINTKFGAQDLQTYLMETANMVSFAVTFCDLPLAALNANSAEDFLDGGVRGMGKNWDVKKQVPIKLDEHPGRAVQFEVSPGQQITPCPTW